MPSPAELEAAFWKALRSDMTVMLGCDGAPPRPMAAVPDGDADAGPLWFFTARDTDLAQATQAGPKPGLMTFASKGHDVWATVEGTLVPDTDRAVVDRLWNPDVAAWYEDGKDDPSLRLVRFDATTARLWRDGSSLVAGIEAMLGVDPKRDYRDKTATVRLDD
ncbi:pyridoxamine 5'-phosphate oxidase family protein [Jannaschia sp. LMIT008]|uniref:pyridoxamine 5'-phosphate oxidase family protein n=1 Tax=Jannaschia maritima TaxID=3032585 RepID=UPI002811013F|nr:pyridoxamine 5'-phosphate oxidase family protein [Jannaschia sp. LMIT008]